MSDNHIPPACEHCGPPLESPASSSSRILVVEDDGEIRRLNTDALRLCGYEVDGAEDGAAGWEALSAGDYDLLITDNDMPKVSGIALLRKLRAARMELPFIMASGNMPERELAGSPWLKPAATLCKPYTIPELLGTVKDVLRVIHDTREPVAAPLHWQTRPAAAGLRLL